jgi:hypothetical protein
MKKFAGVILVIAAVACGSNDSSTGPSGVAAIPSYEGTLALKTANLNIPPASIVQQSTYTLLITGGQIVINHDNTYQLQVNFKLTSNGVTSTPQWNATGTYSVTMVLGQPVLKFVDSSDNTLMSSFTGGPAGVSGSAHVPPNVVPAPPDGQSFLVLFSFSK